MTRQMVEELFTIREMAEDMEDDGDVDYEGNPAILPTSLILATCFLLPIKKFSQTATITQS